MNKTEVHSMPFCKNWRNIAMDKKNWTSAYDGFGQIVIGNGVQLQPRRIASESGTHAALALLNSPIRNKDFSVKIRYRNTQALRTPQANTWEVFWLFFNYQATAKNKSTNYFIFKPNGVELGKAWGEDKQEFLATADNPKLEFGKEYELVLNRSDQLTTAFINGQKVLELQEKNNKQLFENLGQIGLYTEDSYVEVSSVAICD